MKCINCPAEINDRCTYQICVNCKFDVTVMISQTEAKRIYKLTDKEIYDAKLFFIRFTVHHNVGTKYLITEIHELARKITDNLDASDKRKKAFTKQDDMIREKTDREDKIKKLKQTLRSEVAEMLTKYDIIIDSFVEEQITETIRKYCDQNILSEFGVTMKICEDIYKYYKKKSTIDSQIVKQYGNDYLTMIIKFPLYKHYIENDKITDADAFAHLEKMILKQINDTNRKINIDKLLEETYTDEKYIRYAKGLLAYEEFVDDGIGLLGNKFNTIKRKTDELVQKDQRTEKLNKEIDKNIKKKYVKLAKGSVFSKNYIDEDNIKLEKVMENITNYIDEKIAIDKREKLIDKELKKLDIRDICSESVKLFNKYVDNDSNVTLDSIVNSIKDIENMEKRKKIINSFINNKLPNMHHIITNTDEYMKYIRGDDLSLEKFSLDMMNKYKRKEELDIELEKNGIKNICYESRKLFNEYVNNYTTVLHDTIKWIQGNENMQMARMNTQHVPQPDMKMLKEIFERFNRSNSQSIQIIRNKPQTRNYIKTLCDNYGFKFMQNHVKVCHITKQHIIIQQMPTNLPHITKEAKVSPHVVPKSSDNIIKLINLHKESKQKNDKIMSQYNEIFKDKKIMKIAKRLNIRLID